MASDKRSIAVIGAGPVGLEAALYGVRLGYEVQVLERGRVGQNVRSWGHVRLFSPWRLNHSSLGAGALGEAGVVPPAAEEYLTGAEHCRRYLEPLARSAPLQGRVRENTELLQVGRERIGKPELIGGGREHFPFRLLVRDAGGERVLRADVVIDCSGTYGNPNWLGSGGIPAIGERALHERIDYTLRDIEGADREVYAGRRVLLVGDGHSAATALDGLTRLDGTAVIWVTRSDRARPYERIPDDPLPQRDRLSSMANALARADDPRVEFRPATVVEKIAERGSALAVTLRPGDASETVTVDRILAHVGYRPDTSLYRELQVHECYATQGPMALAATLLADDSPDCLTQTSRGAEVLRNPEPGFFILGSKSYGRNSRFLIHLGLEQVRDVYTLIEQRCRPVN